LIECHTQSATSKLQVSVNIKRRQMKTDLRRCCF